ncbi:MAG: right-handed parallel beta-helix repeat-containing protein, partial [Bacteroidota bacterium]
MKKIYTFSFLLILLTGILAFAPGQVSGTVYYVDGSKSDDSGDGLSWATAKQTLRAAFILAGLDDQIWIKAGAYLPTVNTTDPRDNSFFIPDGVSVYGGFAGFETSVGQRNLQANVTILSGDLGTPNDPSDNSYNVIYAGGEDWSAGVTLDGLTIQDGNADVSDNYYQEHGGGLYLSWYNTATVRNCTFKNNYAGYAGGGIHTREGTSLTIDNCKFTLNTAHRGGAVQISSNEAGYSSYAVIKNSEFWENKANWVSGGAIRVGYSDDFGSNDVTITNCIIRDNISDRGNGDGTGAGVMSVETGSVTRIINCAIYGNRAQGYDDGGGGGIYVYMGSVEVYNSTIANNYSATIGGAVAVKDNAGSLLIVNSIIAGNASGTGNSVSNIGGGSASARYTLIDDALACGQTCQNGISCGSGVLFGRNPSFVGSSNFQLQSCSPAIDKGNNGESNEQSTDLAGNARRYSPYGFSPATIDMGAYEFSNNVTVCSTCSPSSGSLSKSPNQSNVCIGGNVLANLSTKGSNGDGLDQLEYRTKTISGWSSWSCYNSGDNISTTDKTEVEIKTYRNSSYCVASTPTVANWVVDPLTVGGSVSGSSPVCQSCNSTTLTLSGQTGFVQNWQYSEDNSFWNAISGSTGTTYTAINLNVDTWFRVSVKSGTCPDQKSTPLKLTMYTPAIFSISGKAKYDNNPQTPLNGIMLVLSKKQGSAWVKTDSMVTSLSGNFTFGGLANAVYRVDAKSAHPSGQWQTWSGVNNTDYLLALRHATTGPLLPANPPVVRVSGDVKTPKTPPVITTVDADAIRMSAKYGWGSPKPYFDIPKWVFSGLNPETRIDSIVLACNNLTRDIMGLCAGDVNGSYLPPTGNKTAVETQGIAS